MNRKELELEIRELEEETYRTAEEGKRTERREFERSRNR